MKGSLSPGSDYSEWQAKREFIAELIDHDGSILDIGCANGFFLKSLQEWSGCQLVPYGIDIEQQLVSQARALFPQHQDNFKELSVINIHELSPLGLPDKYDFIFWNFLGRWDIEDQQWQDILQYILDMARRRVILGFYGTNRYVPQSKEWLRERQRLLQLPASFEKVGFTLSGVKLNPTQFNQTVAWIDRSLGKDNVTQ